MTSEDKRKEIEGMYDAFTASQNTYSNDLKKALGYLVSGKGRDMIKNLQQRKKSGIKVDFEVTFSDDLIVDLEHLMIIYKPAETSDLDEKVFLLAEGDYKGLKDELYITEVKDETLFVDWGGAFPEYLTDIFSHENVSLEDFYSAIGDHVIGQLQPKHGSSNEQE